MGEVTLQATWMGRRFWVGPFKAGEITPPQELPAPFDKHNSEWIGSTVFGHSAYFNTEAEARAAVEQIVIETLMGGRSDCPRNMAGAGREVREGDGAGSGD